MVVGDSIFSVRSRLVVAEGLGEADVGDLEVAEVAVEGLDLGLIALEGGLQRLSLGGGGGRCGVSGCGVCGGSGEPLVLVHILLLERVDLGLLIDHLLTQFAQLALGRGLLRGCGLPMARGVGRRFFGAGCGLLGRRGGGADHQQCCQSRLEVLGHGTSLKCFAVETGKERRARVRGAYRPVRSQSCVGLCSQAIVTRRRIWRERP